MILLPAIDLKDGRVVRLRRGEFDTVHQVADSPLETARAFYAAGARYLHVVDLDGAKSGVRKNAAIVEELARSLAAKSENEQRVKDFLKSMISDISHQVKTPLAALRMYNEITIAEPENVATVRDFAAKSERALDKLEQLIQSLLRLTRLDAGSVVFAREPVALSALVARALEPFSARAEHEHKTMSVAGDDETVLLCDATWTEEAISNLVKNALDHTQTGGHIRISWEKGPALLRLSVSDDGAGISAEDIHHIFKRFYRSTTSSGSGVGLGLPIAKAIVEGQGGTLSVVSASGDGATFTMAFPCG